MSLSSCQLILLLRPMQLPNNVCHVLIDSRFHRVLSSTGHVMEVYSESLKTTYFGMACDLRDDLCLHHNVMVLLIRVT